MSNIGANQTFLSRRTVKSHRHGGTAERDKFINEWGLEGLGREKRGSYNFVFFIFLKFTSDQPLINKFEHVFDTRPALV